jgi:hypothetical protein
MRAADVDAQPILCRHRLCHPLVPANAGTQQIRRDSLYADLLYADLLYADLNSRLRGNERKNSVHALPSTCPGNTPRHAGNAEPWRALAEFSIFVAALCANAGIRGAIC